MQTTASKRVDVVESMRLRAASAAADGHAEFPARLIELARRIESLGAAEDEIADDDVEIEESILAHDVMASRNSFPWALDSALLTDTAKDAARLFLAAR